jgi:signal recognition particle GTPase/intein/homing endonuclease
VTEKVVEDVKKEGLAIKTPEQKLEEEIEKKKGIEEQKKAEIEERIEEEKPKEEKKEKKGLFAKFKKFFSYSITEDNFNDIFSELELVLLESNVALEVVEELRKKLSTELIGKEIKKENLEKEIQTALKEAITNILINPEDLIKQIKEHKKEQEKQNTQEPYKILFFGINGSGKCITGDSNIPLSNGDLISIKDLYEKAEAIKKPVIDSDSLMVKNPEIKVPSLNLKTLKMENKEVSAIWKINSSKYLYEIILNNGQKIKTTPEHPFFTIKGGKIDKIRSDLLNKGDYIAINRYTPAGNEKEILSKLDRSFFVNVKNIKEFYKLLTKKYGNLNMAYSKLGIKQSFNTFAYFWRKRKIIPVEIYLNFRNYLKIKSIQYAGSKAIPIPEFSQGLVELAGLIMAEGHLNKEVLEITNSDIQIIRRFDYLISKIFKIKPTIFKDSRGLIRSRINNWSIIYFFNSVFKIPFGNKSKILKIPDIILKADKSRIISFLRSYIEAESHISTNKRCVEISTASEKCAIGLSNLFAKVGILTTLSKKKQGRFRSYRIYISGFSKIRRISQFGLYTDKNKLKLAKIEKLNKQFELTELIPTTGNLIKDIRLKNKKYQFDLAKVLDSTQALISQYESGVPIPRKNLRLMAKKLNNSYLSSLADSDISWIRVKSIRKRPSKEKWVYDLTIDKNHNFIANGIIVHNTTSIAKLANLLQKNKLSVVLAASDTFRAAAIEQLQIHADRLKVKLIKGVYGNDPSSVAFDAIKYAQTNHIDAVLIDTAGRMHTKENLLKEMEKICRVTKPNLKVFVAEALAGNDATEQARAFNDLIGIDGSILSKTDVDEKGGTILSISYITQKPILYLGIGQNYDDLELFDKDKFIERLGL